MIFENVDLRLQVLCGRHSLIIDYLIASRIPPGLACGRCLVSRCWSSVLLSSLCTESLQFYFKYVSSGIFDALPAAEVSFSNCCCRALFLSLSRCIASLQIPTIQNATNKSLHQCTMIYCIAWRLNQRLENNWRFWGNKPAKTMSLEVETTVSTIWERDKDHKQSPAECARRSAPGPERPSCVLGLLVWDPLKSKGPFVYFFTEELLTLLNPPTEPRIPPCKVHPWRTPGPRNTKRLPKTPTVFQRPLTPKYVPRKHKRLKKLFNFLLPFVLRFSMRFKIAFGIASSPPSLNFGALAWAPCYFARFRNFAKNL